MLLGAKKAPAKKQEPKPAEDMAEAKEAACKAVARALGVSGANHQALCRALQAFYEACYGE